MKHTLPKIDIFLVKRDTNILINRRTENSDSYNYSMVSNASTTISNEKSISLAEKKPSISTLLAEFFKMSNDLRNFINKKLSDREKRLVFDTRPIDRTVLRVCLNIFNFNKDIIHNTSQ
jgi:hypothetical protein